MSTFSILPQIASIISANPIMGIFVIVAGGYAYFMKKKNIDGYAMVNGAFLTAISSVIFGVLGFPILFELLIVMVLTSILKKQVFDNGEIMNIIKQNLSNVGTSASALFTRLKIEHSEIQNRMDISKNKTNYQEGSSTT